MPDIYRFVQFPHPGGEQKPGRDGTVGWNKLHNPHKRKFMRVQGDYRIFKDGETHKNEKMDVWGEWEPESRVIAEFELEEQCSHAPRYLWEPYWVARDSYWGLHNTDPFIFGDCFLYSNCRQTSQGGAGLRNLGKGSIMAFGSGKEIKGKRKWVLDTVFVVRDYIDYDPLNPLRKLEGKVPDCFLEVSIKPLRQNLRRNNGCINECSRLRLYRGATPDFPVNGMFSFFPARLASKRSCFSRPAICLEETYFNPRNWQAPKGCALGGPNLGEGTRRSLWNSLVKQVQNEGLILGTSAQLPKCWS